MFVSLVKRSSLVVWFAASKWVDGWLTCEACWPPVDRLRLVGLWREREVRVVGVQKGRGREAGCS
ncbi:MAG: hypothetical protein ACKERG_04070 [Candidatus Hodgkinia cicadicola]